MLFSQVRILSLLALAFAVLPCFAHAGDCDVVRVEITTGARQFQGSGIVIDTPEGALVMTADHVLPVSRTDAEIVLFQGARVLGGARIRKRDWSSDLLLLQPKQDALANLGQLKGCRLRAGSSVRAGSVVFQGYPEGASQGVTRAGSLVDAAAPEIRLPFPVALMKFTGAAENGMSGGAVFGPQGALLGMLLQSWVDPNHEQVRGAYVISARDLADRVGVLLKDDSEGADLPLPFQVTRETGEISAFGFIFSTTPFEDVASVSARLEAHQGAVSRSGGGHPDGIGSKNAPTALEITGLTGGPVPAELQAMQSLYRRLSAEGGARMLVQKTLDGESVGSATELGRWILTHPSKSPKLEYLLRGNSMGSERPLSADVEKTLQDLVLDAYRLSELNPPLLALARRFQSALTDWAQNRSVQSVRGALDEVGQFEVELDRILDLQPESYRLVIEFRTRVLKLRKKLG